MVMRLLSLFISVLIASASFADEIHNVKVVIDVNKDRSMVVTEFYEFTPTININHGLYRHIPVKYFDNANSAYATPLEILETGIDGKMADYHTEHVLFTNPYEFNKAASDKSALWNKVIYIGSRDVTLTKNRRHTTTLKYRISRIVKEMDGREVLGWNLQGYDWNFTREHVEVTINLPQDLRPEEIKHFISTGQSANLGSFENLDNGRAIFTYDSLENQIHFEIKDGLTSYEDLTFFLLFPPDSFDEADGFMDAFFYNYRPEFIFLLGLLASLIIWFLVWRKHGVDPIVKRIQVLFGAPDNLSPSEVRYFRFRKVDTRSTVAFIVDAAIKGYVKLEKQESTDYLKVTKTKKFQNAPTIIKNGINTIVKGTLIIQPTRSVGDRFNSLKTKLENLITKRHPDQFSDHFNYFLLGCIPLLIAVILCVSIGDYFNVMNVAVGIAVYYTSYLFLSDFLEGFRSFWTYLKLTSVLMIIGIGIFIVPQYVYISLIIMSISVCAGALAGLWRYLVKNQTYGSRDKLEKIKAFEHYLKSTEERLMDFVNKPNEAPALFEKNLPYAIALDCELKWVEAFEKSIGQTNIDYDMSWAAKGFTYHYLSYAMVSSVEVNSDYTPPSSSGSSFSGGGFSGGGFSGGGGFGGGGGGGW